MTGSDAPEASGDNVWTWTVGSGGAGSWSVVSNLGNTMTAGARHPSICLCMIIIMMAPMTFL